MTSLHRPRTLAAILTAACAALTAQPLAAKGAVGFLSPDHTTVAAGEAGSYMELGRDWTAPYATGTAMDGHKYALPAEPQSVTIESWRTATHLNLSLTIEDQTRKQRDDSGNETGDSLGIGDKIIIQIDPNNSGHAAVPDSDLDTGATAIAKDHRFEITLKDNAIDSLRRREPLNGSAWKLPVNYPGLASLNGASDGAKYVVDVTIPLLDIGSPVSDIGIAIAVINDLGHGHVDMGTDVWDVSGTSLPSSMPLVSGSDPGLVDAAQGSGAWVNPSTWATGYFSVLPGEVNLSHNPAYWWSDAIRLSRCDVSQFSGVQEPLTPGMSQLGLTGWYIYNPADPCQMKVWVRASNASGGVIQNRLFVVWGRPGIAPQEWFPVDLTGPIGFSSPEEIVSILWNNVPAVSFTDHPCLRVYVLPAALTAPWLEAQILAIDTQAELSAMEAHYGIAAGGDFQNAQMNFTATSTGSCTLPQCALLAPPGGERIAGVLAALHPNMAWLDLGQQTLVRGDQEEWENDENEKEGLIRVKAEGVGFAKPEPRTPYTYLTTVGGIAWAFPQDRIHPREGLRLPIEVTNPALLFRDFSVRPPRDVPSPPRQIFVVVTAEAAPGVPVPAVQVAQPERPLQAGESTKTTITLTAGPAYTSNGSGGGRIGFSLHAGINEPHGRFSNIADRDVSWMLDLEYRLSDRLSLELLYGHHEFEGVDLFPDTKIDQFSVNAKLFLPGGFWQPFVNAGVGSYDVSPGGSDPGANAGFGVLHMFPAGFGVELGYNFHRVFASPDLDFSALLLGLRWRP